MVCGFWWDCWCLMVPDLSQDRAVDAAHVAFCAAIAAVVAATLICAACGSVVEGGTCAAAVTLAAYGAEL